MTICCEAPPCTLQSNGSDSNLDAFGAGITLQDLTFADGQADVMFGGNVAIDSNGGDIVIAGCQFRNGQAGELGGNLFVQTPGTLTVTGSSFVDGQAGEAGGGLYVLNAARVTVQDTTFQSNTAKTGGGLFSVLESATQEGQKITLDTVTFQENEASIGGGFFVTQLGNLPELRVLNSSFVGNEASDAAGAGAIAESLDNLALTVTGSTGSGNDSPVCEDFLGFFDASTQPFCIDANLNYPP